MQLDPLPKSYCDCWSYQNSGKKQTSLCKCGDNDSEELEWKWDAPDYPTTTKVGDGGVSVTFHPVYSQGTGMVRGDCPLARGRHHFWEIKMTSTVCGTDLMVGVGTGQVDLVAHKYRFVSALGLNEQSWGFSYRGITQHDSESRYYGQKFGAGSIVSCHLDLFRGTLEFYLNRLPLGIAFKNLPVDGSCEFYPMVSSTAAKSSIKLLNSSSFPECLQYQAMRSISRNPSTLNELRRMPRGFRYRTKLWYLQRTEKFIYQKTMTKNRTQEAIFLEPPVSFEGTTTKPTAATTATSLNMV